MTGCHVKFLYNSYIFKPVECYIFWCLQSTTLNKYWVHIGIIQWYCLTKCACLLDLLDAIVTYEITVYFMKHTINTVWNAICTECCVVEPLRFIILESLVRNNRRTRGKNLLKSYLYVTKTNQWWQFLTKIQTMCKNVSSVSIETTQSIKQTKESEAVEACNTHGKDWEWIKNFVGKSLLVDLAVNGG